MLMCGAAIALAIAATPATAQEQVASIDIKAQPMASALRELARQSGANVLFSPEAVRGLKAQSLQTSATPEEAARLLVAGADLTVVRDGTGALVIRKFAPQGESAGGGAEGNAVEALIVTAQKREEDIQDVPIAMSAFSQEALTTHQIAGGPDLITQVPNMTFTKTNFSSYSVQLRGIGTQAISATTDPAVAVAFNNTPFIRNRFFEQEFYDLQRVEVLRGPQGTLYGRNATAGVVNIISAKPKFIAEAKLSGDAGNFSSSRIEGMINIPLVEDQVALRLAGAWTKRDGYATNQLTGNPIDGRDLWSTRLSLRVAPTDGLDVNLIWEHFQEKDDRLRSGKQLCKKDVITEVGGIPVTYFQSLPDRGQGALLSGVQPTFSQGCERDSLYSPDSFQTPNGLMLPYYYPLSYISLPAALEDPYLSTVQSTDLRLIESTIDPNYSASADIGELQISLDIGSNLTLQSETAYGVDFVYSMQDFNRFNTAPGAWDQPSPGRRPGLLQPGPNGGIFCDPQLGCSDRLVAVDISTATARQFSQELRLSSDFDGPFNFSLGANYLRADSEDKYYIFFNSISMVAADSLGGNYSGPYAPGVTDNIECMMNGYAPGDPEGAFEVTGCIYMDPNPIDQVNDLGHNYFLSKNPYKLISYAMFGEAYYQVTDALKITGGLRWTVDKKDAPRIPTWILANNSVGYPVAEVIEQEWREPTGRLTIDWKPQLPFTDDTMVYGSYAHGYKAGGANPPGFVRAFYSNPAIAEAATAASATRPKTFEAEFVDAFEVGAKNIFADGRATVNLAAFYYDYKGYQISEIVDRSAFNRNFDAEVWGLEIEADWRVMENLKLGFKGGYEKTRIADGERAVDLMDRTAGNEDWIVVRPFPTYASSCVLPTYVFINDGVVMNPGGASGGNPSACEIAYVLGFDPVTYAPYGEITDPSQFPGPFDGYPDYPGFDPLSAPNNGEGFYKDLSGNELPNAPQFTATITADYTIPFGDWLATLHTDLHWQSESWWRVFNDHEFSRLDEYFTMNLAAIITNQDAGWNIMAYVKNLTDETAITGAFLNSDDTGLTTNVFLTEPRLYGLRVTKAWTGGPLLWGFGERRDGPSPFTLELGGQLQRHDAPNEILQPSFGGAFQAPLDIFDDAQEDDLDWGDGRDIKLTWRPQGGPATVSIGVRFGKTNGVSKPSADQAIGGECIFGPAYADLCDFYGSNPKYHDLVYPEVLNRADAIVTDREEHRLVDFAVGYDIGFGGLSRSTVSAGVRFAQFKSSTNAVLRGTPDWFLPEGSYLPGYTITHTVYNGEIQADRETSGLGPVVTWDAALPLMGDDAGGRLEVAWSLSAGALVGRRKASISGTEVDSDYETTAFELLAPTTPPLPAAVTETSFNLPDRRQDATIPTFGVSLGLSYAVGGFSLGAGYRWERYFDAIDGGYLEEETFDRTIDGPYFKVSVGFGG
jgi:outer membrane receptor protein involved in Fe transport